MIAIDYTSGDSGLAAQIANKLADVYIAWQREAALEQTKDATAWLSAQIDVLRPKVAEAEAAVEQFKASQGLFAGTNNVTLNAQQLSEVNSQVILAKAQKSEAEARARLIKKMLDDGGDIDATPEVLKSELIGRLIDQRVQVQRQLAELSATLLPSHPRIKQLNSELADVRDQIRDEAAKIVKSLENEAEVASAREASLRGSLNEVKTQASGLSEAEIKLRALEREAKAQRDLLESYLARYRDASARHDMGAVPAQAAIVSRAHASILPSFPQRGPISLLVTVATALLALAYVLARELIGAPAAAPRQAIPASEPRMRERRRVRGRAGDRASCRRRGPEQTGITASACGRGDPRRAATPTCSRRARRLDGEQSDRARDMEAVIGGSSRDPSWHIDAHLSARRCRRRVEAAASVLFAVAPQERCEGAPGNRQGGSRAHRTASNRSQGGSRSNCTASTGSSF